MWLMKLILKVKWSRISMWCSILIENGENPKNFNDYRLISICNMVYKVIIKIIANKVKQIMSKQMYTKQFGFLDNRHILDAIRVDYSIKLKKYKPLIFKVDLVKGYDWVSWDFLRLVLLQVGLMLEATNWIMWCVNSDSFAVFVNEKPLYLFKTTRVLFQGCMLSILF